jgi:glycine/sarcosine N-methyltransferase
MPGFSAIARYYHLFFPAREAQLSFLAALAGPPPARMFDIASGTGEYVAALYARGYDCFGIDLDLAMQAQARQRHPELVGRERLLQGDMLELTELVRGPARLVYCIGNSLPLLGDDAQLREAVLQMWDLTRPEGSVALQVVNFDRVIREGEEHGKSKPWALPTLHAMAESGEDIALERCYDLRDAPGRVLFKTRLMHPGGAAEGETALLCLTRERLAAALPPRAGVQWYGDFANAPWSVDSPATVCVLR